MGHCLSHCSRAAVAAVGSRQQHFEVDLERTDAAVAPVAAVVQRSPRQGPLGGLYWRPFRAWHDKKCQEDDQRNANGLSKLGVLPWLYNMHEKGRILVMASQTMRRGRWEDRDNHLRANRRPKGASPLQVGATVTQYVKRSRYTTRSSPTDNPNVRNAASVLQLIRIQRPRSVDLCSLRLSLPPRHLIAPY